MGEREVIKNEKKRSKEKRRVKRQNKKKKQNLEEIVLKFNKTVIIISNTKKTKLRKIDPQVYYG